MERQLDGGTGADEAAYNRSLQNWLGRFREYPRRAKRRRQEGVAVIRFTFDRQGRVLDVTLVRSSGHDMLDRAALELPRKAQPLPKPSPSLTGQRFVKTLPIEYQLR